MCPSLPVVFFVGEHSWRGGAEFDVKAVRSNPDINAAGFVINGDGPPLLIVVRAICVQTGLTG